MPEINEDEDDADSATIASEGTIEERAAAARRLADTARGPDGAIWLAIRELQRKQLDSADDRRGLHTRVDLLQESIHTRLNQQRAELTSLSLELDDREPPRTLPYVAAAAAAGVAVGGALVSVAIALAWLVVGIP